MTDNNDGYKPIDTSLTPRIARTSFELKPRQWKAIELLATTNMSHAAVCKELGLSEATIRKWFCDSNFVESLLNRSRQHLKEQLPEIYEVLGSKCKSGSHPHMKILFDHLDKLEEIKAKGTSVNIQVNWIQPGDNNNG